MRERLVVLETSPEPYLGSVHTEPQTEGGLGARVSSAVGTCCRYMFTLAQCIVLGCLQTPIASFHGAHSQGQDEGRWTCAQTAQCRYVRKCDSKCISRLKRVLNEDAR